MQATATLILLALATLGDATQIGLFLFAKVSKGAFTLAQFRGRFRTKLARQVMKKKFL